MDFANDKAERVLLAKKRIERMYRKSLSAIMCNSGRDRVQTVVVRVCLMTYILEAIVQ